MRKPSEWHVLVVDGDDNTAMFVEMLLADVGYQVHVAATVKDAVTLMKSERIDLAIVDKDLDDGGGLEVLAQVKKSHAVTEVVMTAANATLTSAVQAIHLGVGDFIQKPLDTDDFLARLERVLGILELRLDNYALLEELKQKNERLEQLALRDGLTGLYNHAYFQQALDKELRRSERHGHEFGLLFIDLDHFKDVNDTLGHPGGDEVLRLVSDILQGRKREYDDAFRMREHDIAARYGGDEFVLILPETTKTGAAVKAERLRSGIERHSFDGVADRISLSIGVAGYPTDGDTRTDLIEAADTALYAAKRAGRNRVMSYEPGQPGQVKSVEAPPDASSDHARALDDTLKQKDVKFAYQPIVDTAQMKPFAYEALCRPKDERFKHVGELINAAEGAGRLTELGRLLREVSVGFMEQLPEPVLLFVNLHPQELNDPELIEGRPPWNAWGKRIVFEITEAARLPDFERPKRTIAALRERGFRIALDDLGAGYAGLTTLAQLRPDFIKLDMALIRNIHKDSTSARLIRHLCNFCNEEGTTMIAEGVETQEERDVVADLGCVLMQGYFFARPGPPYPDIEKK